MSNIITISRLPQVCGLTDCANSWGWHFLQSVAQGCQAYLQVSFLTQVFTWLASRTQPVFSKSQSSRYISCPFTGQNHMKNECACSKHGAHLGNLDQDASKKCDPLGLLKMPSGMIFEQVRHQNIEFALQNVTANHTAIASKMRQNGGMVNAPNLHDNVPW